MTNTAPQFHFKSAVFHLFWKPGCGLYLDDGSQQEHTDATETFPVTEPSFLQLPVKTDSSEAKCPYFLSPSLHAIVTFGHKLLVEKAVEKMNLRKRNSNFFLNI